MKKTSTPFMVFAAGIAGCLLLSPLLPQVQGADAKNEGKPDKDSTNTAPWRVSFSKSEFVGFPDIKDRSKYKGFTDPFFPKTERIFPRPKTPPPTVPAPQAPANATDVAANAPAKPEPPPPPPPPKWHEGFSVTGVLGSRSARLVIVQVGGDAYYFRSGATKEVITSKGPVKVTCLKINDDTVELRMDGEKDIAVLELP